MSLLWERVREHLDGDLDCIKCKYGYTAKFETAMLIVLYRFFRPSRIRPEMKSFFGMRESHISSVLHTITCAMETVAEPYLNQSHHISRENGPLRK